MIGFILLAVVVLFAVWLVGQFNGLVQLRNQVQNAWSQIDVQLKRRADLIPNLVNTVKGVMKFEQETLERVMNARARALGATTITERGAAEAELSQGLGRLLAVMENYPELKSNQNALQLQEEAGPGKGAPIHEVAYERPLLHRLRVRPGRGERRALGPEPLRFRVQGAHFPLQLRRTRGQEVGHDEPLLRAEAHEHDDGRPERQRGKPLVPEGPAREVDGADHAATPRSRAAAAPASAWPAPSSPGVRPAQASSTVGVTPRGSRSRAAASSGGRKADRRTALARPAPASRSR